MRSSVGKIISLIFLISWIIIGNYVLLNLFLAILLDGFNLTKEFELENKDEYIDKDLPEKIPSRTSIISFFFFPNILICKKSLFLFDVNGKFRRKTIKIVEHRYFDIFILILIILSSLNLVLDTYIDKNDENIKKNKYYLMNYHFNLFFNSIFLIEALLKIISNGLFICPNSYLRDSGNIMDFIIVIVSWIDIILIDVNLPSVKVSTLNI